MHTKTFAGCIGTSSSSSLPPLKTQSHTRALESLDLLIEHLYVNALAKLSFLICVCVHDSSPFGSNFSVILLILYLSKNSSFQRSHIIHMSLGGFKPSGGRLGMGCRTGTYFSRTTKDFTSKSCLSPNLCSIVTSPNVPALAVTRRGLSKI